MTDMEWIGRKAATVRISVDGEETCCANCKYFVLHYIRYDNGQVSPLCMGHCVRNHRIYMDGRLMRNGLDDCKGFEKRGAAP